MQTLTMRMFTEDFGSTARALWMIFGRMPFNYTMASVFSSIQKMIVMNQGIHSQ